MVRLPFLLLSLVTLVITFQWTLSHVNTIISIGLHNVNPNRTFDMEFHDIAALSPEQYKRRLGLRISADRPNGIARFEVPYSFTAPDSFDWREKNVVAPIKDQRDCGSCWAFAAVGALEGQHAKKKGEIVEFSEQNLVDCSTDYGNKGCEGGLPENAYNYVKANGGIDTEDSYPYQGDNAVALIGPISVGMDANHLSFQGYKEGVYYEPGCDSDALDHAVLVVGYGTDEDHGDYWIIKNSWGTGWGEKGYFRIARNRDNHCGIATLASYPIVN